MRKFLKRLQLKISPAWKRKQSSPRGTKSPIQDKPKEKHTKTHTNQANRLNTKKDLRAAREKQQVTYKGNPIHLTADLSAETLQARREWQDTFKVLKGKKSTIKITGPRKDLIQNLWRNEKLFRQAKVKRIQYHQTNFTTTVKRTYVVKKYNRRETIYKINPRQLKWQQELTYQ